MNTFPLCLCLSGGIDQALAFDLPEAYVESFGHVKGRAMVVGDWRQTIREHERDLQRLGAAGGFLPNAAPDQLAEARRAAVNGIAARAEAIRGVEREMAAELSKNGFWGALPIAGAVQQRLRR